MKKAPLLIAVSMFWLSGVLLAQPQTEPADALDPSPQANNQGSQKARPTMSLDEAFQKVVTYKFGESRQSQDVIEAQIRKSAGNAAELEQLNRRLVALLTGNSSVEAKRWVCRQLWVIGRADAVPALAALLPDAELSDMARYALERLQYPQAGTALRDALGKVNGKQLVGVINSIGERRDTQAVAALANLTSNVDESVAEAAIRALGKIGGPQAAGALASTQGKVSPRLRTIVADSRMKIAAQALATGNRNEAAVIYQSLYTPTESTSVRMAALRGLALSRGAQAAPIILEALNGNDVQLQKMASGVMSDIPGTEATTALAGLLPQASVTGQVAILRALAARGDVAGRATVVQAATGKEESARIAALQALAVLGDASTVPLLAQVAATAKGQEQAAAQNALQRLRGADINSVIVAQLNTAALPVRAVLVRSLGNRNAVDAVPTLLQSATDANADVRLAALDALSGVAGSKDMPALLKLVESAKGDAEIKAAEKALVNASSRAGQKEEQVGPILAALNSARGEAAAPVRASLLRVLGGVGGTQALQAVQAALKDNNADVQTAAVRTLGNWTDITAAPVLLDVAKTSTKPILQVLALQGYIRLAGTEGLKTPDRMKLYTDAMTAAQRPDEKRLVLAGVGRLNSHEALAFAVPALNNADIREEAAAAVVSIAGNIKNPKVETVEAALKKVLEVTKSDAVRKKATDALTGLKK